MAGPRQLGRWPGRPLLLPELTEDFSGGLCPQSRLPSASGKCGPRRRAQAWASQRPSGWGVSVRGGATGRGSKAGFKGGVQRREARTICLLKVAFVNLFRASNSVALAPYPPALAKSHRVRK